MTSKSETKCVFPEPTQSPEVLARKRHHRFVPWEPSDIKCSIVVSWLEEGKEIVARCNRTAFDHPHHTPDCKTQCGRTDCDCQSLEGVVGELLPCSCGGKVMIKPHMDHGDFGCRERAYYGYCGNCWARGPAGSTKESAAAYWNIHRTRVPVANRLLLAVKDLCEFLKVTPLKLNEDDVETYAMLMSAVDAALPVAEQPQNQESVEMKNNDPSHSSVVIPKDSSLSAAPPLNYVQCFGESLSWEDEARRLLTECCYTINQLAAQQSMPDLFYESTLESVGGFLNSNFRPANYDDMWSLLHESFPDSASFELSYDSTGYCCITRTLQGTIFPLGEGATLNDALDDLRNTTTQPEGESPNGESPSPASPPNSASTSDDFCYAPGDEGSEFCGDPKRMHCNTLGDAITHEHLVKCMRDDHFIHHPFVATSDDVREPTDAEDRARLGVDAVSLNKELCKTVAKLRAQLHAQSVEDALVELREMFPGKSIFIDVDVWAEVGKEPGGHGFIALSEPNSESYDHDFSGKTLAEAMAKVRQYAKEQQK